MEINKIKLPYLLIPLSIGFFLILRRSPKKDSFKVLEPYEKFIDHWSKYWSREPISFWDKKGKKYIIKPKYKVDPNYIRAIILWEHRGKPKSKQVTFENPDYSYGLMQVYYPPAVKYYGFTGNREDLLDISNNIFWGVKEFATQLQSFKGNVKSAVMAYNTGRGYETPAGRAYYKGWKKYYEQLIG